MKDLGGSSDDLIEAAHAVLEATVGRGVTPRVAAAYTRLGTLLPECPAGWCAGCMNAGEAWVFAGL